MERIPNKKNRTPVVVGGRPSDTTGLRDSVRRQTTSCIGAPRSRKRRGSDVGPGFDWCQVPHCTRFHECGVVTGDSWGASVSESSPTVGISGSHEDVPKSSLPHLGVIVLRAGTPPTTSSPNLPTSHVLGKGVEVPPVGRDDLLVGGTTRPSIDSTDSGVKQFPLP